MTVQYSGTLFWVGTVHRVDSKTETASAQRGREDEDAQKEVQPGDGEQIPPGVLPVVSF